VIVDASALIAISRGEPESALCFLALLDSPITRISAANWLEATLVVDGWRDPEASREFDALLERFKVVIEPVTPDQARIAREANQRFGKRSGHPARLNFGDCFAYALAMALEEPLLFVGQDFVHTDVRRVLD
jgi:ribonuclease VapC